MRRLAKSKRRYSRRFVRGRLRRTSGERWGRGKWGSGWRKASNRKGREERPGSARTKPASKALGVPPCRNGPCSVERRGQPAEGGQRGHIFFIDCVGLRIAPLGLLPFPLMLVDPAEFEERVV